MTDTTNGHGGFRPAAPANRVRRITYGDDSELAGLVLRIGGLSMGEWLTHTAWEAALPLFAERLIEWNWVDGITGAPVPATPEGVATVDAALLKTVVADWLDRATGVVPLGHRPRAEVASVAAPPAPVGLDPDLEAMMSMTAP